MEQKWCIYSQANMFVCVKFSVKAILCQYRKGMIMARLVNQYTCLRVGCFSGFFHLPENFACKRMEDKGFTVIQWIDLY